jgi:UDP-N-acetylglucosamine 1-carboxyvinyltransferase
VNYGKNIKEAREYRGITQAELAEKVGIARSTLAQLEIGALVLTLPMAVAIAEALKVEIMELINGLNREAR